jgi:putative flippase GtrA
MIKDWRRKFLFFALLGAMTTGIQYVILILAVELLQADPVMSSCTGYLMSAVLSYVLNYHFTFKSDHAHFGAATRFALVSGTGLLLNGVMMYFLLHSLRTPYIVAQLIATAIVLMWNFLGSALWAFGARRDHATH